MTIWKIPISIEEINRRGAGTLADHLGIVFTEAGDDFLSATMPVDHRTIQPMGILNGGASCALAETVGSTAANFCVDPKLFAAVGLDININHIKAVKRGFVTAIAKPFHLGKSTQVWDIKIYDEEKRLVSVSRLTLSVIEI